MIAVMPAGVGTADVDYQRRSIHLILHQDGYTSLRGVTMLSSLAAEIEWPRWQNFVRGLAKVVYCKGNVHQVQSRMLGIVLVCGDILLDPRTWRGRGHGGVIE